MIDLLMFEINLEIFLEKLGKKSCVRVHSSSSDISKLDYYVGFVSKLFKFF